MSKKRILLISGCSHAAGFEIFGDSDTYENRQASFGNVLAREYLDRVPVNMSLGGATNPYVSRSIMTWINTHYDPATMDLMVLAAWTDTDRMDSPFPVYVDHYSVNPYAEGYIPEFGSYNHINVGWKGNEENGEAALLPLYHDFILKNRDYMRAQSCQQIIMLQNYLDARSIEYVMCNTMHIFDYPNDVIPDHITMYTDLIDNSRYLEPYDNNKSFYWFYKNAGYENPLAKWWHHGEEPHRLYAEKLYRFIS